MVAIGTQSVLLSWLPGQSSSWLSLTLLTVPSEETSWFPFLWGLMLPKGQAWVPKSSQFHTCSLTNLVYNHIFNQSTEESIFPVRICPLSPRPRDIMGISMWMYHKHLNKCPELPSVMSDPAPLLLHVSEKRRSPPSWSSKVDSSDLANLVCLNVRH